MSKDQMFKGQWWICVSKGSKQMDEKSKESNGIAKRLPLTQPSWGNTYERMWKSRERNYTTITLVTNAHIIINIEKNWKWHRCTNTICVTYEQK